MDIQQACRFRMDRIATVIILAGLAALLTACGSKPSSGTLSPATQSTMAPAGTWSSGQEIDTNPNGLNAVSCPTARFCMAIDQEGVAYRFSNVSWSHGQQLASSAPDSVFGGLACPTVLFCMVVGLRGYVVTYSKGLWSSGQQIGDNQESPSGAVSCPAIQFCMAAGNAGQVYEFLNGTWSSGQEVDLRSDIQLRFNQLSINVVLCHG